MNSAVSEKVGDIWAFNPDQMGEEGLMATLVGRDRLIEELCNWLRQNKGQTPQEHLLFYGPRGIGKTTLLLATYYTVLNERDLRDHFIPVKFPENAGLMPDEGSFVTAVHEALHAASTRTGTAGTLRTHPWQPTLRSLADFSRTIERQFVFFLDNLQAFVKAVLEGRGGRKSAERGLAFLKRLLGSPEFLIIGCSLQRGPRRQRKDSAFWKRFDARPLDGLASLKEATGLLEKRAEYDGEEAVLARFRQRAGRVRGVFALSQGNPRYLVLLYKLLRQETFEGIQADLKRILDGLSSVLDEEISRQVTSSRLPTLRGLCKCGGRADKNQVAAACRLPGSEPDPQVVRQVGDTLSALTETDFVEEAGRGARGLKVYQTTPPLFQLCFEMRYLGMSHRVVLLEIFDSFLPAPGEEVASAYQSLMTDLRAHPESAPDRVADALFFSHVAGKQPEYLADLMDVTREAVRRGGHEGLARTVTEFREIFERAGSKGKTAQLGLVQAYSDLERGDADKADEELDRVLSHLDDPECPPVVACHALRLKAEAHVRRNEGHPALHLCQKARARMAEVPPEHRDRLEGDISQTEGEAYVKLARRPEARACYERAQEHHHRASSGHGEARDLLLTAVLTGTAGDPEGAAHFFRRSADIADGARDQFTRAAALRGLAHARADLGQFRQAVEAGQRAAELAREVGDRGAEVSALRIVAGACNDGGQLERAIENAQRAARLAREIGDRHEETFALEALTAAYHGKGQLREAARTGQEALELAREVGHRHGEAFALQIVADVLRLNGDLGQAAEIAQQAAVLACGLGSRSIEASALRTVAAALRADGQFDGAIEKGQKALAIDRELNDREGAVFALNIIGSAYAGAGRYDEAIGSFTEAESTAESIGEGQRRDSARANRFRALLERAREHALAGDREKASTDVRAAGEVVDAVPLARIAGTLSKCTFVPLLTEERAGEAAILREALTSWAPQEIDGFVVAVGAAIEHVRSREAGPISRLPPVERALAYEIVRQAQGKGTVDRAFELSDRGKTDEALSTLEELLRDSPDDLVGLRAAVSIALDGGQVDVAERYAHEAMKMSGGDPEDIGNLGLVLEEKGDGAGAQTKLEEAAEQGSGEAGHYLALARIHDGNRRFHESAAAMRAALQLDLSAEQAAVVRLNLAEYQVLTDRSGDAPTTLEAIERSALSTGGLTDFLFHRFLSTAIGGDRERASSTLTEFCGHLVEHGEQARSSNDFMQLVSYAQDNLGEDDSVVLRRWADVAGGNTSVSEFVQLYGSPEQRERSADSWDNERGLALSRLSSGKIRCLDDIVITSTREDAVEAALDAFVGAFRELPSEGQALCRDLISEALSSESPSIARAGLRAAGGLFWLFPEEERAQALSHMAHISGQPELPIDLRDAALRVIGALYFHLAPEEKTETADALRSVAEHYAPRHLRELLARIRSETEEPTR